MKTSLTSLSGVLLLEPEVFSDSRGMFYESYNCRNLAAAGIAETFVQDNHTRSQRHVLRGLHYQIQHPQGKLVRVIVGAVLDVVVDLRRSSTSFGRWASFELSAENRHMVWVPPGFAHGYLAKSECAEFLYKTTTYWAPDYERIIAWNDPTLTIDWQLDAAPILSTKDALGALFEHADVFP